MGIIVNKEDDINSDLTRRITTDLREKAESSSLDLDTPDFAKDAAYVKDLKKTSKFGWVWLVLIALAIIGLILIGIF